MSSYDLSYTSKSDEIRTNYNADKHLNKQCHASFRVSTNRDGQIGLCRLTQLTDMDLSYNYLAGDVPTCFMQIRRYTLLSVAWMVQFSLSELTCFAVFEQIKLGRNLFREQ